MAKFCEYCGQPLQEGARFCPGCGTPVDIIKNPAPTPEPVRSNAYSEPLRGDDTIDHKVRQFKDGKYRWVYEMPILSNPTIFLTVFKVFAYILGVSFVVFGFFIYVIHGNWAGLWEMAKGYLIALGIIAVLNVLGVLVIAAMYKGKYIVMFEMDEQQIKHIQVSEQFRKAKKMGQLAAFAGMLSGNFTTAGAGMLMASKDASVSNYSEVRRVIPRRKLHVIKVNEFIEKNQIYVPDEDFDFVYDYIKSRCTRVKS